MAGAGSRFVSAGFATPKPLINVDNIPMFMKTITSIEDIELDKKFIFIIRQEHVDTQNLDKLIVDALPQAEVVVLPELTRGSAETALQAKPLLDREEPLIVMDCDLWFKSESYNEMVNSVINGTSDISGGVLTFKADNPRYSYALIEKDNIVTETAEKKVISNNAITGAYFFATAKEFIDACDKLLETPVSDEMPEYYLSLLYNILIDEGKKIQAAYVDEFASFGTPEELEAYQSARG